MARSPIKPPRPIPKVQDQVQDRTNESIFRTVSELVERSRDNSDSQNGSRFIGRQIITASGAYRPSPGTNKIVLKLIGGGGGGGSATSNPGTIAAAGGGSSGVLLTVVIGQGDRELKGGPVVIGAGGAGAAAGGSGSGGAGGQSSITIDGIRYTANGGAGGTNVLNVTTNASTDRVAPSTGDQVQNGIKTWGIGTNGVVTGGSVWISGDGGSTELGAGGLGMGGTIAGSPGNGYGSGGGGAAAQSANRSGGLGAPGVCIIDEYGN